MNTTASTLRHPHPHFPIRPRQVTPTVARPAPTGTWRYSSRPRRGWGYTAGLALSVGLHTAIFFGLSGEEAPAPVAAKAQEQVVQIEMPPLPQEEPEQQPEELVEAQPVESVAVPQLMEVPQMVTLNEFTQQVDLRPQTVDANALRQMAIPVNHGRGGTGNGKFGDVFKLSDLDRIPQAVSQAAPQFPQNIGPEITKGRVLIGFIVDAEGNVLEPRVIESTQREFERPAVNAVARWKFRPGMKGGRKVATRMEVPINFELLD
jgi:protein TonB